MINKYKLIKKYPGCPNVGTLVSKIDSIKGYYYTEINSEITYPVNYFREEIEDYPEFWEKVIEKDYEILQFICKENRGVENAGTILTKRPNGSFWIFPYWTEEEMLKLSHYAIYSVKRLSDGEIFTIGDICDGVSYERRPILEFKMIDNTLSIRQEFGHTKLSNLKKSKTPLFTTEDGVDKFAGDMCYFITPNFISIGYGEVVAGSEFKLALARFHDQYKAKVWVEENKPQFSKKDMIEFGWKVANECTCEVKVRDCFNRYIKK